MRALLDHPTVVLEDAKNPRHVVLNVRRLLDELRDERNDSRNVCRREIDCEFIDYRRRDTLQNFFDGFGLVQTEAHDNRLQVVLAAKEQRDVGWGDIDVKVVRVEIEEFIERIDQKTFRCDGSPLSSSWTEGNVLGSHHRASASLCCIALETWNDVAN